MCTCRLNPRPHLIEKLSQVTGTPALQAEIARAQALRADAPSAAGVTVPPKSILPDFLDAGFGYMTSKVQKQVLSEVRGAHPTALENRVSTLPPDDQRRRAFEKGHKDRYSDSLPGGVPL